jgi:hypothetical protein
MPYGIGTRRFAIAFWRAVLSAVAMLVVLAILEQHLSTGWRMFVLERVLKALWAATAAIFAGVGAGLVLDALNPRRPAIATRRHFFAALKWLIVMATVLGTLGYFMPDWTPVSVDFAILILMLWMIAGTAAAVGR